MPSKRIMTLSLLESTIAALDELVRMTKVGEIQLKQDGMIKVDRSSVADLLIRKGLVEFAEKEKKETLLKYYGSMID